MEQRLAMMLFRIAAIAIMIVDQDPLLVANIITNVDPISSVLDLDHLAVSCDDLFAMITLEN